MLLQAVFLTICLAGGIKIGTNKMYNVERIFNVVIGALNDQG